MMEKKEIVYDLGGFQYIFTVYDQPTVDLLVEGMMRANAAHVMSRAFDRTNVTSREIKDDLIKNNMGG